jgi:cytochrome P450
MADIKDLETYFNEVYGPVADWMTDFDHANPAYNENAHALWDEMRDKCPVAHTTRYGGTWLPVTHEYVSEIAYDTDRFTSRSVVVSRIKPSLAPDMPPAPIGTAPPISSDPPFHHDARRVMLPAFAPKKIAAWEADVRALCNELLDSVAGQEVIDAAVDYAQHIPVNVIARMLGFPLEDSDLFRKFVHDVLEGVDEPVHVRQPKFDRLFDYISVQIEEHQANPREDLTSFLLNATIYDQPLSMRHVAGSIVLLLLAGIDTTWSAIGSSIWHLATTPADRERLVREPDLMPTAIEEFLRAYAPVTMARLVKEDIDFHGCPMKAEDWVLLPFPAANRDPKEFADADKVIIDREENRHSAFGLGIHRCMGSNLARLELTIAVEEFLKRYPNFELSDTAGVKWSNGQIRGPRKLPVRILPNK